MLSEIRDVFIAEFNKKNNYDVAPILENSPLRKQESFSVQDGENNISVNVQLKEGLSGKHPYEISICQIGVPYYHAQRIRSNSDGKFQPKNVANLICFFMKRLLIDKMAKIQREKEQKAAEALQLEAKYCRCKDIVDTYNVGENKYLDVDCSPAGMYSIVFSQDHYGETDYWEINSLSKKQLIVLLDAFVFAGKINKKV